MALTIWLAIGGLVFPLLSRGQEIPANLLQEDFQIMRHALQLPKRREVLQYNLLMILLKIRP